MTTPTNLNDDAVLNINIARFYTATAGQAAPAIANLADPGANWTEVGHTTEDNIFTLTSDGGDTTVLRSLQASTLRTSTAPRTETFAINLLQFDEDSLKLYFGSNAVTDEATGWMPVPDAPAPTSAAFLAVFTDGTTHFGIYCNKCEIARADDLDFADTTSLASLPIKVTPLNASGSSSKWSVTPLGFVVTP